MEQSNKKRLIIIGLFSAIVIGLPFLNKPYHIDDTFVLAVSQQILKDPLRPLDGVINWRREPESIFNATLNPPLLSYYLALFIILFGYSEVALHIGMILFLVLFAIALALLSQRFARSSLLPLLLVLFSPPVVVSSNVMRDVPAAALAAMAVALFIIGTDRDRWTLMLGGSILAGLAILTKYSSVVIIPVLAVYCILNRRWKPLIWLVPALLILGLWCLQNQLVHGQIHLVYLMQKRRGKIPWQDKFYGAIVIIGSSLFLIPALLIDAIHKKKVGLLSGAVVVALLMLVGVRTHYEGKASVQYYLWSVIGGALLFWVFMAGFRHIVRFIRRRSEPEGRDSLFLAVWLAAPFLFSVIFVPFQAVRHLIPALAPLSLLAIREIHRPGWNRSRLSIGTLGVFLLIQAIVAFLVNAADYEYANTYRRFAEYASAKFSSPEYEVWFVGSWGWQYYGKAAGFTHLWPDGRQPKVGDLLIEPQYVHKGRYNRALVKHGVLIEEKVYTALLPIRTMSRKEPAGFYATVRNKLPYFFTTKGNLEIFRVYRITTGNHTQP